MAGVGSFFVRGVQVREMAAEAHHPNRGLNAQVFHIQRVVVNKLAAELGRRLLARARNPQARKSSLPLDFARAGAGPLRSRLNQQRLQLCFDRFQIGLALKLRSNIPISVDEVGQGQTKNAAIEFTELVIAHRYGIIQTEFRGKPARQRRIVVHRDSNDLKSLRAVFLLPLDEPWHLDQAGSAPCGPEIEQHHFTPEAGQIEGPVVQVRARELRRFPVEEGFRAQGGLRSEGGKAGPQ